MPKSAIIHGDKKLNKRLIKIYDRDKTIKGIFDEDVESMKSSKSS